MNQKQPQLACDAVCFRKRENEIKQVILITRGHEPFLGKYAFPGGHLDYGEDPTQCCLRELKEETGILGLDVDLIDVKGAPDRDPRGHYVSIVYKVEIQPDAEPVAADDAKTAQWLNVEELLNWERKPLHLIIMKSQKKLIKVSMNHYNICQVQDILQLKYNYVAYNAFSQGQKQDTKSNFQLLKFLFKYQIMQQIFKIHYIPSFLVKDQFVNNIEAKAIHLNLIAS